MCSGRVQNPVKGYLLNRLLSALIGVLCLTSPLWAADPRLERAFALIEQENWEEAEQLATEALNAATTEIETFEAHEALATLRYYTDDGPDYLRGLHDLDDEAIRLFGRDHERRLPVLELLALTYEFDGDTANAARQLTRLIRIARQYEGDLDTLHFAQLNLANLYLGAGDLQTAAILAADLALSASEAHGADDEVALEAALLRASAHLQMDHPIEAVIQAMPLILLGPDRFGDTLPDLAEQYSAFDAAITERASRDGEPGPIIDRWFADAQATLAQRNAIDEAQLIEMEGFAQTIYAKDATAADVIARQMTATVLADDPFPVGMYTLMITTYLVAHNTEGSIPWAKRLAAVSPEYLATTDFEPQSILSDVTNWLAEHSRFPEALEVNALALQLINLREDPHSPALQNMRLERSNLLAFSRRYEDARVETERALADNIAYRPADPALRSRILFEFGQTAIDTKDFATAQSVLSEAVTLMQSAGLPRDLNWAETLTSYANTLTAVGRGADAIPILEQSLRVRQDLTGPVSSSTATGQITLAAALADAQRYDEAAAIFDGALATYRNNVDSSNPVVPAMMLAYAGLLGHSGQSGASERLYREAALLTQDTEGTHVPFEVLASQQLAKRAWSQDRLTDASSYLNAAMKLLPADDPSIPEIRTLQARIALETGDLREALYLFRDVSRRLDQPGQGAGPNARDYLPAYIETLDRLARAHEAQSSVYLDETFLVAQTVNGLSAGRVLSRAAARWNTTPVLSDSLRRLQNLESGIAELRGTFRDRLAAGDDAVDIQARLDADIASAKALRNNVVEQFPNYARFATGQAIDLATLAGKLRPDEVMVLFATSPDDASTGESGSVILAVTHDALRTNATANRDVLRTLAVDLRCAAALTDSGCGASRGGTRGAFSLDDDPDEATDDNFDLALAHRAYLALLDPVADALKGKTRLIVVPDQSLTAMPFHLLVRTAPTPGTDLRDAAWLLRDMSVVVVPTVASFDALRSRGRRTRGNSFLGVGDPLIGAQRGGARPFDCEVAAGETVLAAALDANGTRSFHRGGTIDTDALANLPALPDTRCELQHAARLFADKSRLLLQGDATETQLKALSRSGELASYRNLSFATHGLIAGEVGASEAGLVMTPPATPSAEDDGLLTTGEIAQLQLDADFVFLSACNTAAGSAGNDEGLSGLASAFFYAGARSLLVSHWPVYSDAATRLTTQIVSRVKADPGLGLSDALRFAMLDILDDPGSDQRMRHPAFWAPFMIVGEGAPRP